MLCSVPWQEGMGRFEPEFGIVASLPHSLEARLVLA